jgi:5-methylcytosine-specific restriction enzyme A
MKNKRRVRRECAQWHGRARRETGGSSIGPPSGPAGPATGPRGHGAESQQTCRLVRLGRVDRLPQTFVGESGTAASSSSHAGGRQRHDVSLLPHGSLTDMDHKDQLDQTSNGAAFAGPTGGPATGPRGPGLHPWTDDCARIAGMCGPGRHHGPQERSLMPVRPPRHHPAGWRSPRPWQGSTGQQGCQHPLPRNWPALRRRVLAEEPLCRPCAAAGRTSASREVDHIVPRSQGGTTERVNLQGICSACHRAKTTAEALAARRTS